MAGMIRVTDDFSIDDDAIGYSFIRAGGPGGQHVNKAATAVQLSFDTRKANLPAQALERLKSLAGRRMSGEGDIVITARRFRSQEDNRADALEKLIELIRLALTPPRRRIKTRATLSSKLKRIEGKRLRARTKKARGPVKPDNG